MRKYNYRYSQVLNEYAYIFFGLVEESLKIDGGHYMMMANISSLPYLKKPDAQKLMNNIKKMGDGFHKSDIKADREALRQLLSNKV
jgi:hypothetical protein